MHQPERVSVNRLNRGDVILYGGDIHDFVRCMPALYGEWICILKHGWNGYYVAFSYDPNSPPTYEVVPQPERCPCCHRP